MQITSKEIAEQNLKEINVKVNYLDELKALSQRNYVDSFEVLFEEAENDLKNKIEELTNQLNSDNKVSQTGL